MKKRRIRRLRREIDVNYNRRKMFKFSASVLAVGIVGGGLRIGSAYLLTGGSRLKDDRKPRVTSKLIVENH